MARRGIRQGAVGALRDSVAEVGRVSVEPCYLGRVMGPELHTASFKSNLRMARKL